MKTIYANLIYCFCRSKSLPITTTSSLPTTDETSGEDDSCSEWEDIETESDNGYSDDIDQSEASSTESLSSDDDVSDDSSESEDIDQNRKRTYRSRRGMEAQVDDPQLNELIADPDQLISYIQKLLKRIRSLITFIHQSNPLDRYIHQQIYLKQAEMNKRAEEQKEKPIKLFDLVLDFKIRWNTTFTMLCRFVLISSIITDVTFSPCIELGLDKRQYEKLRNFSFSRLDWQLITALQNVLAPFYETTQIISASKYPTLSLAFTVLAALKNFLSSYENDEVIENALKKIILLQFNYYCDREITPGQKRATLVCNTTELVLCRGLCLETSSGFV